MAWVVAVQRWSVDYSTTAVEASLAKLWIACWCEAVAPAWRDFGKVACFLISDGFSMACTPVYRSAAHFCAQRLRRYPRNVLTPLCSTCGKAHRACAVRGLHEIVRKLSSSIGKALIHRRFIPAGGLSQDFPQCLWGETRRRCGKPVVTSLGACYGGYPGCQYVF